MEIKFFFIFLFYLAFFRVGCNAEYNISEQLQISTDILQVYNRDLDNSIKWKELKNVDLDLDVAYHTDETLSRMERIRYLINGAADSYFESSHEMYDWASSVASKLTSFERMKRQNRIVGGLIVDISQQGKEKAEKSIEKLMTVRQKFSNASVECRNIIPYFDIEELKKSDRFKTKKNEVQRVGRVGTFGFSLILGSIGGVLGTLVLPGVGTFVGGALARQAGVLVGSAITELAFVNMVEDELHKVNDYFEKLYPRLNQAADVIDDVVKGVKREIARVPDVKSEASNVATVVEAKLQQNKHLVDGEVEKLLDQCNTYKLAYSS